MVGIQRVEVVDAGGFAQLGHFADEEQRGARFTEAKQKACRDGEDDGRDVEYPSPARGSDTRPCLQNCRLNSPSQRSGDVRAHDGTGDQADVGDHRPEEDQPDAIFRVEHVLDAPCDDDGRNRR